MKNILYYKYVPKSKEEKRDWMIRGVLFWCIMIILFIIYFSG